MPLDVLSRALWSARWWICLATALLLALGTAVILSVPRAYVAEAIVAPAETTGMATSSMISTTGFAAAAGGLLDNRPTGNFAVYLAALRSPEAAALLVRDTPLLQMLTARRENGPGGLLRRVLGLDPAADADDARNWLESQLSLTQSLTSVTWTLELAHPDREAALDALRRLHAFAESKVRDDLAQMAARRMAALQAQLARETDIYLRTPLFDLLAQHQRAALMVAADEQVAARLVSLPMVELRPSLPNRPLLLALLLVAAPLAVLAGTACLLLLRPPAALRLGWRDA
jgi:hypothetical protein